MGQGRRPRHRSCRPPSASGSSAGSGPRMARGCSSSGGRTGAARRRPSSAPGPSEDGGEARRLRLPSLEALLGADLDAGEPLDGPLLLVCVHGRAIRAARRQGLPVFDTLASEVPRRSCSGSRRTRAATASPRTCSRCRRASRWASRARVGERRGTSFVAGRIPSSTSAAARSTRLPARRRRPRYAPPRPPELRDVRVLEVEADRVVLQTPDGVLDVGVDAKEGLRSPRELRRRSGAGDGLQRALVDAERPGGEDAGQRREAEEEAR